MDFRIIVLCVGLLALVFVGVEAPPPPGWCGGIAGHRRPGCTSQWGKKSTLDALIEQLMARKEVLEEDEKEAAAAKDRDVVNERKGLNEPNYQDTREYDVEQEKEIRLLDFLLANNKKDLNYESKD
ncbi:uncharacterized protein [Antedon mediterranea]|uniref:uncharacterized protein n=1 Tax=Antedon mediterranea TaxID=105859 RepID=UPI003AF56044